MTKTSIKTKSKPKNSKKPAQVMVKMVKKIVKPAQETMKDPDKSKLTILMKWGKKFRVVEMPDGSAMYLKIQDVNLKDLSPEYTSPQIIGGEQKPENEPNSSHVASQTIKNMLGNAPVKCSSPIVG